MPFNNLNKVNLNLTQFTKTVSYLTFSLKSNMEVLFFLLTKCGGSILTLQPLLLA
jgi:hypothetical protein